MGADSVDLNFYASQAFLRDWNSAFPTMKDYAVSKVDLLRRRAASSVDWLHHYDTVELQERLGRCIEIEIGPANRLIARVDGADVTFVGIGDHEITERIKRRLTGRERADALEPPAALIEGPAGLFLPWDDSATERGGIITYNPASHPSWAYYLSEQQEIIRDRIWLDVERLVSRDHWERGTHLVMGGPGTGKTSILLSLLRFMDVPSMHDDDDCRIGLRVSPQMRAFIERHTGWSLERVCDAIETPRELDIILVDDPATVADVEKWVNFGNTKNSSRRRPLVVVGFDPLQLGGEFPDVMLDAFAERPGVSLHWVTACYRQKEVPGRLALGFARQAGEANPYGQRTKKATHSKRFREVCEMVHCLSFENPSGWSKAYPKATEDDWEEYARVVQSALVTEVAVLTSDSGGDEDVVDVLAWPPCLVVQMDGARVPEEWTPLYGGRFEGILVNTRSTSAWSDKIKGLEYQHVAVVLPNERLRKLLSPDLPDSLGPKDYETFRLLRIPFSRARDTLAVFGV